MLVLLLRYIKWCEGGMCDPPYCYFFSAVMNDVNDDLNFFTIVKDTFKIILF